MIVAVCSLVFVAGCANNAQTYSAYGGAGGALIGAAAGGLGGPSSADASAQAAATS
ncbi:MAG: hypothetical protein ACYTEL_08620 [Planctomycetota bacterium]|jgi:hypothetical protein